MRNDNHIAKEFSKALKLYRLSQKEIANSVGCSSQTIYNISTGRTPISPEIATALSDKYGFNLSFLLTGEGEILSPEAAGALLERMGKNPETWKKDDKTSYIGHELERALADMGVTPSEVGKALGFTSGTYIYNIISGRVVIGRKTAQKLHDLYGFSTVFLLTGSGAILPPKEKPSVNVIGNSNIQGPIIATNASGRSSVNVENPVAGGGDCDSLRKEIEELKEEISLLKSVIRKFTQNEQ